MTAEKLDPGHMVFNGRFGRESMVLEGGQYYKDMSYLNRNLKRVVVIETDPKAVKKHLENTILISEFTGNSDDKAL